MRPDAVGVDKPVPEAEVAVDDERLTLVCDCGRTKVVEIPAGVDDRDYVVRAYCEVETRVNDCCDGRFSELGGGL